MSSSHFFIYTVVTTSGVGMLGAASLLVRNAFKRRTSLAVWLYASIALAAALKFCYDLNYHRAFWEDDSLPIALLNYVGIVMINSFGLLLVVLGCAWLMLGRSAPMPGKQPPQS